MVGTMLSMTRSSQHTGRAPAHCEVTAWWRRVGMKRAHGNIVSYSKWEEGKERGVGEQLEGEGEKRICSDGQSGKEGFLKW